MSLILATIVFGGLLQAALGSSASSSSESKRETDKPEYLLVVLENKKSK